MKLFIEMIRNNYFIPLTYNKQFAQIRFQIYSQCGKCQTWSWDTEVKSIRWLGHAEFPVGRDCSHHNGERYANGKNVSLSLWHRQVLPMAEQIYFRSSRQSIGRHLLTICKTSSMGGPFSQNGCQFPVRDVLHVSVKTVRQQHGCQLKIESVQQGADAVSGQNGQKRSVRSGHLEDI